MLNILFEDNHLLVLSKPANLPTQPAPNRDDSLETQAKAWLKNKYNKPGNVYLHAIHRLDTPVSGVVVFAKTSKALSRLQAEIRAHATRKIYHAWLEGVVKEDTRVLEHYLLHGEHKAIESHSEGKKCRLSFKVLQRLKERTQVEIELETGRYHQIRAQLSLYGHPVWGDVKYGSKLPYPKEGIALHHSSFTIKHPITEEMISFIS